MAIPAMLKGLTPSVAARDIVRDEMERLSCSIELRRRDDPTLFLR